MNVAIAPADASVTWRTSSERSIGWRTTRNISATAHRRDEHDLVPVFERVVGLDVILVDGVEEPRLDRRELGIILLERAPEVRDGAAVPEFFGNLCGAHALSKNREKFHGHFHWPLSCATMWPSSGRTSFFMPSSTAPFEPGSEINTLPFDAPATARLIIAAEPMSW